MGKEEGTSLEGTLAALLDRRASRSQLRRLTIAPSTSVDFSSNSYLSLSTHPEVQRAFIDLLQSQIDPTLPAPSVLGSGGSRLLDGNTPFAETLEREIAAFHRAPAGLLFNSGFDANVGLFSCVPQPGDIIVYDELIHASVHDGMRLSRASKRLPFLHNTVELSDDTAGGNIKSLDALLQHLTNGELGQEIREGTKNVFIAVEGVYSMDGDVTPLEDIVACVERRLPKGNGYIIVDEAHSTGLYGEQGRGLVSELGLEPKIFARVHTFGKAMSCSGGKSMTKVMQTSFTDFWQPLFSHHKPYEHTSSTMLALSFTPQPCPSPLWQASRQLMTFWQVARQSL